MKHYRVHINGKSYEVAIEELESTPVKTVGNSPKPEAAMVQRAAPQAVTKPSPAANEPRGAGGAIAAPLPGTVLKIEVKAGDQVQKGDTLIILEAMKMENEILAPHDGTVQEIAVVQGASVNAGDPLIVLKP